MLIIRKYLFIHCFWVCYFYLLCENVLWILNFIVYLYQGYIKKYLSALILSGSSDEAQWLFNDLNLQSYITNVNCILGTVEWKLPIFLTLKSFLYFIHEFIHFKFKYLGTIPVTDQYNPNRRFSLIFIFTNHS